MGARNIIRLLNAGLKAGEKFPLISGDVLKVLPNADDTGAINIGDGATDMDVKVFLGATTDYVLFDVGNGQVSVEGAEVQFGDSDKLEFGDASGGDVNVNWTGSALAILPAVDDTGAINIGDGSTPLDLDVKWFSGAATKYVLFDRGGALLTLEDVDLHLGDNDALEFGDAATGDVRVAWNSTALNILPAVDDTGAINIGNGTLDMDLKWFGGTTAKYALFDMGNALFQLEDVDQLLGDDDSLTFGDGNDVKLVWNATYLQGGPSTGMWANAPSPAAADYTSIAHELFDDFNKPASATASDVVAWDTNDDAGTGTNAFQNTAAGMYNVVTAAADNDYHAMSSPKKFFLFVSGKKLWFEARFKLAEATTNESAWWFGLTDTLTTGGFQANALGPLTSYDGALIWKDEGTMEIDFETSAAATQLTTSNMATAVTNTFHKIGFYFDGTATTSIVTPYVDGVAGTPQNITLAGLNPMYAVFGVKAGPSGGAETLVVDYIKCVQLR